MPIAATLKVTRVHVTRAQAIGSMLAGRSWLPRHCYPDATMSHNDEFRLNRMLDRLERQLPAWISRPLRWLRAPGLRWLRIPLGVLLMIGGVLSILPILGLWMLPIGLLLLAQDIPFLRRPTRRGLLGIERRYVRHKRARRAQRQ
jgi:hypothetical protein